MCVKGCDSKRLKGGPYDSISSNARAVKLCWKSRLCEPREKKLDTLLSGQGMGLLFYRRTKILMGRGSGTNIPLSIKLKL